MTDAEKVAMVKLLTDETTDATITSFLTLAGAKLHNACDPYRKMTDADFLARYADVQVDLAAYMLNKRGWDYETRHSENGVVREYETGDIPPSILARVTPICGTVS